AGARVARSRGAPPLSLSPPALSEPRGDRADVRGAARMVKGDAVSRIVALLDLRWSRIAVLLALGLAYAACEGAGVGMLLPVLRHVEQGHGAGAARLLSLLGLAFLAVVGRQVFRYVHQVQAERMRFDAVARLRSRTFEAFLGAGVRFHAGE